MEKRAATWWCRGRVRCAQVSHLLLAFTLIGLTTACSREPSEKKLRTQATSPPAEARRAAEERRIRALIDRLSAVEGLEHVGTRLADFCARPYRGSVFENFHSPYTLTCDMRADVYFGVRGDITDVLPRIRAAGIAAWGPHDGEGRELPHAAGTVAYALDYHRAHGRDRDGTLMPAPTLEARGMLIEWDRSDLPLPNRIEEPTPCPPAKAAVYQRCALTPDASMSLTTARTRYGTVLRFSLGDGVFPSSPYFTVARRK
ncbi:hypothetical protein OIB37_01845 [Streptomyces sp. NBC_00820]|uniref:hypothetical protein n=1 Tax=Streptomyces sp. NBC_00820 TaxID=2975842 RepID=UPI002ED4A543|nr:hypothetical protein OIB37_01845 [Streptomyces sp. NBC_00820]